MSNDQLTAVGEPARIKTFYVVQGYCPDVKEWDSDFVYDEFDGDDGNTPLFHTPQEAETELRRLAAMNLGVKLRVGECEIDERGIPAEDYE
jgi:hypothetical protein